jgi:dephospho-CoA kinase
MYVIAVTGGIGSGKSVACEYFRSRGAIVLSLDDIAHQVLEPSTPQYAAVVKAFGQEILDATGRIDRAALAAAAFEDRESTERLNAIVHPAVLREVAEGITNLRLMQHPPQVVVFEIPLLVEAPVFADVADTVLSITAPEDVRIARVVAAGRTESDARLRVNRQASDAQRAALADNVIANTGSLEAFLGRLEEYWETVAPRGS